MAADVSGAAGDQNGHGCVLMRLVQVTRTAHLPSRAKTAVGERPDSRYPHRYTSTLVQLRLSSLPSPPHVSNSPHPYDRLTPDVIIAAVESLGYVSDRRILALNSYENRVYQVGIEDGPPLIAKFYRPDRWSDAAIAEEHGFALELAAAEIPVVPPLVRDGRLCSSSRVSLRGVRAPRRTLAGTRHAHRARVDGTFSRAHTLIGRRQRFRHRGRIDIELLGR